MPNNNGSDISSTTVLSDPAFRYYPMWDVRANEIYCYICEPFWDIGDGGAHPEEDFTEAFTDSRRVLTLDLETLHHAISRAEEVAEGYGVFPVMIPVHFITLADQENGLAYIEACNEAVWSVIDSLSFEIIRPPPVLDPELLKLVFHKIGSFGNSIMLRVEQGFDQFELVALEGVDGLGRDVRGDTRSEDELVEELKGFATRAGNAGLFKYVHGIETPSLSLSAVATGFDIIGSDSIAEPLEEWAPDGDTVAPVDLLKSMLKAKGTE